MKKWLASILLLAYYTFFVVAITLLFYDNSKSIIFCTIGVICWLWAMVILTMDKEEKITMIDNKSTKNNPMTIKELKEHAVKVNSEEKQELPKLPKKKKLDFEAIALIIGLALTIVFIFIMAMLFNK